MSTFFPLSVLKADQPDKKIESAPRCRLCQLDKQCKSPKLSPTRVAPILFVGERPSAKADKTGRLSPSPDEDDGLLASVIKSCGLDTSDWSYTTSLACAPVDQPMTAERVAHCRPTVTNWILEHKPTAVVLLGSYAIHGLIGGLWKSGSDADCFVGFEIPDQTLNAWIVPTYSPQIATRFKNPVMKALLQKHVRRAVHLSKSHPWKKVPNYADRVQIEMNPEAAAAKVVSLIGKRPVAFDYETNMLKPDHKEARIVCYSVSDGETTLATPYTSVTRKALRELVRSGTPMVASNKKFELRWTKVHLGTEVKKWGLCTMLASHVLDYRPGINSIKFQAYVQLGQRSYDDHIKPFLKTKGGSGYEKNQIHKVHIRDLLLYCGLDSLLEWEVARIQYAKLKGSE